MGSKKRRGPSTDPFKTPVSITLMVEETLPIETNCALFFRYDENN